MGIKERYFQLDNQWCVVHLPERPNGFAVLVLGDTNHYVNAKTSFWIQNSGRNQLLENLRDYGYTIFYSNLYGRNWGSSNSVRLARQLIYYVLKSEILNKQFYILAEGMGALVALKLMEVIPKQIRAVAMLSPCLDLQAQIEFERENKFFYKRMLKEIAAAYEMKDDDIPQFAPLSPAKKCIPLKIWQISGVTNYPSRLHCRKYEELLKTSGCSVSVVYHLPEKRYDFAHGIYRFFEEHNDLP